MPDLFQDDFFADDPPPAKPAAAQAVQTPAADDAAPARKPRRCFFSLAPDAAQLISSYRLDRPGNPQTGINTRLMRKRDGRWVIALNHVSSIEQVCPPTK